MQLRMSACILMTAIACSGARWAAADEISSSKDLLATIVLNGKACDQVIDVQRTADSDYLATCKDGNRYHVFVNPQGRVVVQKM